MAEDTEMRKCQNEKKLEDFLHSVTEKKANQIYGSSYPLHIKLQIDAAKRRLSAVSTAQAELAREGWEIIAWEKSIQININMMRIKGRIDRVDKNRDDGRIRIYDYKTSDKADNPIKAHIGNPAPNSPAYARVNMGGKEKQIF